MLQRISTNMKTESRHAFGGRGGGGGGGGDKFIYLKASKEVNLPVLRMEMVVSLNISLLVTEL